MIEYGAKDIFDCDAECIVNPVNSKVHLLKPGHQMGLAGTFEEKFPAIQASLKEMCKIGQMQPGRVQFQRVDRKTGNKSKDGDLIIANLATKDHWQPPSKMEWVKRGSEKLAEKLAEFGVKSVAIPPLGTGYGKLDWKDVQREMHIALKPLADKGVKVMILGEDVNGYMKEGAVQPTAAAPKSSEPFVPNGPVFSYGGIGARDTPEPVLKKMREVAAILGQEGGILRSGGADGADDAFEQGAKSVNAPMEIFIHKPTFNGRVADGKTYIHDLTDKHFELAEKYHPAWDKCNANARGLMARNSSQNLGRDLKTPSDVMISYSKNGAAVRGTGQSIRMSKGEGIPMINMGGHPWKSLSAKEIAAAALQVARKEASLAEVEVAGDRKARAAMGASR